ncbi:MAG: hypothetical protein SPF51_00005, partial [Candidatus Fimivicinus sp.]|nr:hypothetical protein [Candidatus Fimivicinus sp.]
ESSSLGRFAERVLTCLDLSAAEVPCKRPLLLPFPAERKRKGLRGLSAVQFLLPLSRQAKKAEVTQKFYEIVFSREVSLNAFVVLQVSLTRLHSLCSMQRERSKRNTRGGMSPTTPAHGTSAAGS